VNRQDVMANNLEGTANNVIDISADTSEFRRAIGTILVSAGHLNVADLDRVHRFAAEQRLRFGEAAVRLNLVSEDDVEVALGQQFSYPILTRGGENGVASDLIAGYDPQSTLVEPLRVLRSQLMLRWPNVAPRKVMVAVTSPDRGEGRSWLAANLATVFAQAGERTLLIDADMRHPSQHRLFNLDNRVGLSALLTGRAAGRDVVQRIHPELRLFVLPAGILPPNPQELLVRPLFSELLERVSELYTVIVLDTPPATKAADAQVIAARAGAALLLVRRNRTRAAALTATMDSLIETGVKVIGSVVTEH
jgi:protein-tyrosine kinase